MAAKRKRKKKAATKKRKAPNPLKASPSVKQVMATEGVRIWSVTLKGTSATALLGHVTGKNEADAKKRAIRLVKAAL